MRKKLFSVFLVFALSFSFVGFSESSLAQTKELAEAGDSDSEQVQPLPINKLVGLLLKEGKITNKPITIHILQSPKVQYYLNGMLQREYTDYQNKPVKFATNGKIKLVIFGPNGEKYTRHYLLDTLSPRVWRAGDYVYGSDDLSGFKKMVVNGKTIYKRKYKLRKYRWHNNTFHVTVYDKAGNKKTGVFMLR